MRKIDTGFCIINFISQHAALIDIKPEQVIDSAKADMIFDYTDEFLDGDYGIVFDCHPGQCFNISDVLPQIYRHERLGHIAMVLHDDQSLEIVKQEIDAFAGDMALFPSIVEATDWLNSKFS